MTENFRLRRVTSVAAGNLVNYVAANQSLPNPLLRQLLALHRTFPRQEQVNFTSKQGYECQVCALYSPHSKRFTFAIVLEARRSPCGRTTDSAGLASDPVRNLTHGSPTGLEPDSCGRRF